MIEQNQRPHHVANIEDLLLEIKKFHVLTSRKDNYVLDMLKKSFNDIDRIAISWEYSENQEYSINAIVLNTKTLSTTLNLKSENNALSNYQPMINF